MRTKIMRLVAFLTLHSSLVVPALAQAPRIAIEGRVLRLETNEGISGARVTLERDDGQKTTAVTSDDGAFAFTELNSVAYSLTAEAAGYASEPSIRLADGKALKDVVIRLAPAGAASGRIRNEAGEPLAGVQVRLLRSRYLSTGAQTLTSAATAVTDSQGDYRFSSVAPGRYYLQATPADSEPISRLYPGVLDLSMATPIDVRPVFEVGALDFTLGEEPIYRIRGRVIHGQSGEPSSTNAIVLLFARDNPTVSRIAKFNVVDGSFELSGVPRGTYIANASIPRLGIGRAVVDVVDSDIDGVTLGVFPPRTLSARVRIGGTSQAPPSAILENVSIDLMPSLNGLPLVGIPVPRSDLSASDGRFTVENLIPGEYQLHSLTLPAGYYVKEAWLDGVDVLHQPLQFQLHSSGNMEIVLSPGAAQIGGTVLNERSRAVADATVVLVPRAQRNRPDLHQTATTGSDGRFQISSVPPGEYQLFAWQSIEPYAYLDTQFLLPFESESEFIRVSEFSMENVELRALPR
jgi:5-hydroxyisourate hydrolase-like protein (transthyretin family)